MAMDDTLDRVRELVSTLFDTPIDDVTAETSPANLEAWDSMGQLTLILEIEQEFGIEMTHERVQEIVDVGSLAGIIDEARA